MMDNIKKSVGQRIQLLRLEHNMTQEEMSEKLNLSTSAYCKIEYGETDITLSRLAKLAEIFEMTPGELFGKIESSFNIGTSNNNNGFIGIAKDRSTVRVESSSDLKELVSANARLIDMLCKRLEQIEMKLDRHL